MSAAIGWLNQKFWKELKCSTINLFWVNERLVFEMCDLLNKPEQSDYNLGT